MSQQHTFVFKLSQFSEALAEKVAKFYPELKVESCSARQLVYRFDDTSDERHEELLLDLRFYDMNPHVALENICSRLSNYFPQNDSQLDVVRYANMLLDLNQKSGAGLYMYGDAGIGKTHIAVSLAKEFMLRGYTPNFQSAERFTFSTSLELGDDQVWIIDDLNSGYGVASRLFRSVVLNVHERGGRVFITSNKDYDQMIKELFVGDGPAYRARYEDRTKGMMKVLQVSGDSQRQASAWYN